MDNQKLNVKPAMLPQLMGVLDKQGEYVLPSSVMDTLANIKKKPVDDPNQIVFTGYSSFESVPCLDKKAFRYLVKDGKMFLCERVVGVGGATEETVLTELGEFIKGTEFNPDFTEIAKIKEGKTRQRKQQLEETERLAKRAFKQINNIASEEVKTEFNNQCEEVKRFVRPGKPDFYASQVDIMADVAAGAPEISDIYNDYVTKVENKNQKWVTAKLKEPKKIRDYVDRVGTNKDEGIGKIDPKARERFNEYYAERMPQIMPYLTQENEEIIADVPEPPKEVVVSDMVQIDELNTVATQQNERQIEQQTERIQLQVTTEEKKDVIYKNIENGGMSM